MVAKMSNFRLVRLLFIADIIVLLFLFLSWSIASTSGGDVGLGWGVVFLACFIFISIPLFGLFILLLAINVSQAGLMDLRWLICYALLSLSGHLYLAYVSGFFDEWIAEFQQYQRSVAEPGQVKLEQALYRSPISNIDDVLDAIKQGADPNKEIAGNRMTFLVLAASRSDIPTIKALLDAGAAPNTRAVGHSFSKSPSPLDVAAFSEYGRNVEMVELLIAAGAEPSQSLLRLGACHRGDLKLYNLAYELAVIPQKDDQHQNCLHHVASNNQVEFLELILFDPHYNQVINSSILNSENYIGQFPLDIAAGKKHFQLALQLYRAGGKANKKWTIERLLDDPTPDPYLDELKRLILQESIAPSL